ncbi:ABC transporter substrate binding protein [uncultured Brachyspira sp.]|uniref:ABC transporter substrate-binding protein n=1 Tax=uncultured Brachyspira sp. TaxID=221953 RepID=UPI00263419D6|nr:ABC transporter substrate binding protein [uncultured Brachyspira sp.]
MNPIKYLLLSLLLLVISCSDEESSNKTFIVSLIKEENDKKFNSLEKGLLDQISLDKLNVKINFYTSNGDDSSIIQIANNVRDDNSTIAIVLGENATLLSMNIIVPQSIVFAGSFNHISLSSIEKNKIQNNNITGVYVDLDITEYLKIISDKEIKSLGYLHTGESRISSHISEDLQRYCNSENISYYPMLVNETYTINDIEKVITSAKIDYLFIAKENYIDDNIYNIDYLCDKYSIPIINTDIENALNSDILFSLDCNYYYLGRKLALLLKYVMDNDGKTDSIDFVQVMDSYEILLNKDTSKTYQINFSDEIIEKSSIIISNRNVIKNNIGGFMR